MSATWNKQFFKKNPYLFDLKTHPCVAVTEVGLSVNGVHTVQQTDLLKIGI